VDKRRILDEIKRIAAVNGGKPPGRQRFEKETGIREWYPHVWLRWGDALAEAGFEANRLAVKMDSGVVLEKYTSLVRELGRVPRCAELRVKAKRDPNFPSHGVFDKFGSKDALVAAVWEHCERVGAIDVLPLLGIASVSRKWQNEPVLQPQKVTRGYVYLIRSGRHYKGWSQQFGGSSWVGTWDQNPVPPKTIHYIETDDPVGIEAYWHRRFADKRGEGEWFNLRAEEIAAFKRWKKIV
jgi:Meiotically up-regulated gene 113